jgi:3-phenylpropionate/cinnamic acid dioxygenase small subunit
MKDVRQILFAEARALDDKDWDAWLAFYTPDAEFWMPSWDDDDKLVTHLQSEVSLIYYATVADWRTACSESGPNGQGPPASRSREHPTTSVTWRSSSKAMESVIFASTG